MGYNLEALTKEWNGYQFKLIEKTDHPAVLAHLRQNFYHDEPMHKILRVTAERIADMDQRINNVLDLDHGSFYVHPANQPEKIAAVLIIWHHVKNVEAPSFEDRSPITGFVRKTLTQLEKQYNIYEERQVDVYPELFIISTDREHRGKGLASEMYRRAIEKLRSDGHKLVSSTFSNPYSRRIGEKLGFKPVARVELNDVKNDDGSLVYGRAGDKHFIIETVLEL